MSRRAHANLTLPQQARPPTGEAARPLRAMPVVERRKAPVDTVDIRRRAPRQEPLLRAGPWLSLRKHSFRRCESRVSLRERFVILFRSAS